MSVDLSKIRAGDEVWARMIVLAASDLAVEAVFREGDQSASFVLKTNHVAGHVPQLDARPRDWRFASDTPPDFWSHGKAPNGLNPGDDVEVMFHGGSTARGNLTQTVQWGSVTAYRVHPRAPSGSGLNPKGRPA